jgi:hypothetical protein
MLDGIDTTRQPTALAGLYAATVQKVHKDGRLDVSVPAAFDATAPEAIATARPCFPYAHFFVPNKGDLVWVAFEGGDPTAPVWLGAWYAKGTTPAEADADPPVKRVIKTKAGHLLILDDSDGAEQIVLADKTGNRIELRTDGVLIKCKKKLTIDASGQEIEIKADAVKVEKA